MSIVCLNSLSNKDGLEVEGDVFLFFRFRALSKDRASRGLVRLRHGGAGESSLAGIQASVVPLGS